MNTDSLKLIRFVCAAPSHVRGHGDSVVTIHDGAWAFCSAGASADGHIWQVTAGLPVTAAIRFAPFQVGGHERTRPVPSEAKRAARPAASRR